MGSQPRIVVPIARCLAKHGIPVALAAPAEASSRAASRSRVWSRVEYLTRSSDQWADELLVSCERLGASWLVPCTDAALAAVAAERHRFHRLAAVACPRDAVVRRVLNRSETMAVAAQVGLRVPMSFELPSRAVFVARAGLLPFPLVAKPARKVASHHDFESREYSTVSALAAEFDSDAHFGEGLVFQDFVPGVGIGVHLLIHAGAVVAAFQRRRLRELPPQGGAVVAAVTEPVDPNLLSLSTALLTALEWQGVGSSSRCEVSGLVRTRPTSRDVRGRPGDG